MQVRLRPALGRCRPSDLAASAVPSTRVASVSAGAEVAGSSRSRGAVAQRRAAAGFGSSAVMALRYWATVARGSAVGLPASDASPPAVVGPPRAPCLGPIGAVVGCLRRAGSALSAIPLRGWGWRAARPISGFRLGPAGQARRLPAFTGCRLMLAEDEAVAVVVGSRAAEPVGLGVSRPRGGGQRTGQGVAGAVAGLGPAAWPPVVERPLHESARRLFRWRRPAFCSGLGTGAAHRRNRLYRLGRTSVAAGARRLTSRAWFPARAGRDATGHVPGRHDVRTLPFLVS